MTAAQKAAKEKFKKAIQYRTKTGVSLKEAFAHVYGRKVGAVKKKAAPKKKAAIKKAAPKKKAAIKKEATVKAAPVKTTLKKVNSITTVNGVKKAAPKKLTESHKDTKSHNVNIRVVSGIVKGKPSVIILSKKIQKLTDLNLHNESVLALAKFLKEKKSIVLIQSLMKMMFSYGYMTNELTQIKRQILSELLKKFKNMYGEVDYKIIYDSF